MFEFNALVHKCETVCVMEPIVMEKRTMMEISNLNKTVSKASVVATEGGSNTDR